MTTQIVCPAQDVDRAATLAAAALARGGLVALPTDTVYGLAARADDEAAVGRLFEVKGRREDNPLPLLIPDAEAAVRAARMVPPLLHALAREFWPGPLTVVLPKADAVSDLVTAGRPSAGLRVPDHPITLAVLRACEFLVAVTSANLSGQPPARDFETVQRDFGGRIELILAAEPCPGGVPSSVVDLTGPQPTLLRAGAVSPEELERVLADAAPGIRLRLAGSPAPATSR